MIPPPKRRIPWRPLHKRIEHNLTRPLLLQLPIEIRHQIYSDLYDPKNEAWIVIPHRARCLKYRPFTFCAASLSQVCRLLCLEVRAWLAERLHFHYRQPEKWPIRDVAGPMPGFMTANLRLLSIGIIRKRKVTISLPLLMRLFPALEILFLASRYVGNALQHRADPRQRPTDADVVGYIFSSAPGKGLRKYGIRYDLSQGAAFPDLKVFVKLKARAERAKDGCWTCHKRLYMAYMVLLNEQTVFRYYDHRLENRVAQKVLLGKKEKDKLDGKHMVACDCSE